jgi:hypothetical protein
MDILQTRILLIKWIPVGSILKEGLILFWFYNSCDETHNMSQISWDTVPNRYDLKLICTRVKECGFPFFHVICIEHPNLAVCLFHSSHYHNIRRSSPSILQAFGIGTSAISTHLLSTKAHALSAKICRTFICRVRTLLASADSYFSISILIFEIAVSELT